MNLLSVAGSSFAFLRELDAPLLDLVRIFLHEPDAPLLDLHLHFYMNFMLPFLIYMKLMLRCLMLLNLNL